MSFVHNQERIVPVRDREQVFKRCEIAIHAVEALDYDPDPPRSARGTPVANCAFDNLGVVMGADSKRGSASSCSFVNAGVNQGIKDEQVVPLRQRCQHRKICDITTAEEERGLRAEEPRRCCFEAFVLLAVTAQKP